MPAPVLATDLPFGPLASYVDIAQMVSDHFEKWMHTWLAARERKVGITPGSLARPRSYIIRHTPSALPGEERTPVICTVYDGFLEPTHRNGSGVHTAMMKFTIIAYVLGPEYEPVTQLAGHYQAAMLGIALKHKVLDGEFDASLGSFTNVSAVDLDDTETGRSMSSVRIELAYKVENFANEYGGLTDIPDEPLDPAPAPSVVLTHSETLELK